MSQQSRSSEYSSLSIVGLRSRTGLDQSSSAYLPFRVRLKHDFAMEERGRWWVFDRPLWRDPLFVIGIGVGLISVVSVILLRDEYGSGAFVFALLTSLPAGVFASGVVIGTPREYVRGRRQRTP
jgi:hypothetical protein